MTTAHKKTANKLNQAQVLKLGAWLTNKLEHIKQMKLDAQKVADLASKELLFPITKRNLLGIVEGMELEIPSLKDEAKSKMMATQVVNRNRVAKLRLAFLQLAKDIGAEVPDSIKDANW